MITRRTLSFGLMMTILLAAVIAGNGSALAQGNGYKSPFYDHGQ